MVPVAENQSTCDATGIKDDMNCYHIHITGLVQGVGFRPYVYRLAERRGLTGWVSNTKDGVHIEFNADEITARDFYKAITQSPPVNSVITKHSIKTVPFQPFTSFQIITGSNNNTPDLLLTPDFAICEHCRQEIKDKSSRRYGYPFTTCLQCGPRYSIIKNLPYERHHTTMQALPVCKSCKDEYHDVHNRRHYSQTNSCPDCAIPMQLYQAGGQLLSTDYTAILAKLQEVLTAGSIAAVKGIGGYLLLCDATNKGSIQALRQRKHRPAKPFALLYASIESAGKDVEISDKEKEALEDKAGPIVLCRLKPTPQNRICTADIAPGLDKMGVMLPCSPLLQLIASAFAKPLIATSANTSGSPIIYKDEEALALMEAIADYIIVYNREIMLPQDDSVLQFNKSGNKIIIRRSRGLAPNYFPNPFEATNDCILALGGELKSAFALQVHRQLYISQYLGNQENLASQTAYTHTARDLLKLLQTKPKVLLADKHPGYAVSQHGNEIMANENIPLIRIQHHQAHFGAVLAENHLLDTAEPVLGIIWDGAGYGDDHQIWGGEFFLVRDDKMKRVAQLDYFPQLLGDKMNREPRLAALSLLSMMPAGLPVIQNHFSGTEWQFYGQLINQPPQLLTSSMGRLLDGIASLLNICHINTYEGEAAMKLEAAARSYKGIIQDEYPLPLQHNRLVFSQLLKALMKDITDKKTTGYIAKKLFLSLASVIGRISDHFAVPKIAFSGGVFQNALLTDMISEQLAGKKQVYWHRQLSPNDECIGFGQLACYHLAQKNKLKEQAAKTVQITQFNHLPQNSSYVFSHPR